jgi:hypothetical protein
MSFDIGSMGMSPKGQQRLTVDISKIKDITCVKCGLSDKFTMVGAIKMISPIQSPSGKWDTAINASWVCIGCHHPFNANEWLNKQKEELTKDAKAD